MNGKEVRTDPTLSPPRQNTQRPNQRSNNSESDKSNRAVDIMRLLSRK
jgi:hypothetical protein